MLSDDPIARRHWRIRIFALTWIAYAGYYLVRKNFAVAMPVLSEEMGFDELDLANIITGYSLMYALGQFASGTLTDRFGPRRVLVAGMSLSIMANLLMGVSTSFMMLAGLGLLNGLAQSSGWPGTVNNIAPWFKKKERGTIMGWWGTCYVLGGSVATLFATWAAFDMPIAESFGWRRVFVAPALLLTVIVVIYGALARNRPRDAGLAPIAEDDEPDEAASGAPADPGSRWPMLALMREPVVWVMGVTYFLIKLTRYSFLFWLPMYLANHVGVSMEEAGYTSSVYELVGFLGAIGAGVISDRWFNARRMPVGSLMLFGLALACLVHPYLAQLGTVANVAGIGLIGIFTFGPDTLIAGASSIDVGKGRAVGSAAGFVNGVGSFGQLVSPYLVAVVAKLWGWDVLFYLFVVVATLGGILLATKWNWGGAGASGDA